MDPATPLGCDGIENGEEERHVPEGVHDQEEEQGGGEDRHGLHRDEVNAGLRDGCGGCNGCGVVDPHRGHASMNSLANVIGSGRRLETGAQDRHYLTGIFNVTALYCGPETVMVMVLSFTTLRGKVTLPDSSETCTA